VSNGKKQEDLSYMLMGIVKEVRKNGAVAVVKNEDSDVEQKYFIPGWAFTSGHARQKQLTTTQGKGLSVGDLVTFYIDPNMQAKPYDAVAGNVDILKQAEVSTNNAGTEKAKAKKIGPPKKPPVNWIQFLMTEELATESDVEVEDPDYEPPEDYEDVDDFDSDISSDEIKDLAESLDKDIAELAIQTPPELPEHEAAKTVVSTDDSEKLIKEVDAGSQENKAEN